MIPFKPSLASQLRTTGVRLLKNSTVRRLAPGEGKRWREAVASVIAPEERDHELLSLAEAEQALSDARCYMIVADSGEGVVGLLSAYRFPDLQAGGQLVYLYDIEVLSAQRNLGYGRMLIQCLIEQCELDDVDLIWAGTEGDNAPARTLFTRTGAVLESQTYAEYEWNLEEDL